MLVWVRSSALVPLVVITLLALACSKSGKAKKDSTPKFTGGFTDKVLLFARSEKLEAAAAEEEEEEAAAEEEEAEEEEAAEEEEEEED